MRVIVETDGTEDFQEIIITEKELEKIRDGEGVSECFCEGLRNKRILNIFLRKGNQHDEKNS